MIFTNFILSVPFIVVYFWIFTICKSHEIGLCQDRTLAKLCVSLLALPVHPPTWRRDLSGREDEQWNASRFCQSHK
jgi:hypothetical protein